MKIFKYELQTFEKQTIVMPEGEIKFLSAQMQRGLLTVWAMVDEQAMVRKEVTFYIFGTGHDVPANLKLKFIGTVQQGPYVWHVFQELQ